jgi:signal transduction histidine kinase
MQLGSFSIGRSNRRPRAWSYTTRPCGRATTKVRSKTEAWRVPSVSTTNFQYAKYSRLIGLIGALGLFGASLPSTPNRTPSVRYLPRGCGKPRQSRLAAIKRHTFLDFLDLITQSRCRDTVPNELATSPVDFTHQRMETVDRLAAGVAHEFNNVLQIVQGYVSFARDALPADSEPRQDLEAALNATNRAAELASRLLIVIGARSRDHENRAADISDIVSAVNLLLRPIIGENIRIFSAAGDGLPEAGVNETSFRQALLNLCINARDAMPSGGDLLLETDLAAAPLGVAPCVGDFSDQCYVRLSVSDTGDGIPAAIQQRIFQPFFTTKAPGKGTGLGLAMVAACVADSGGAITVQSTLGEGTRFDLYLPLADAAECDALAGVGGQYVT